MSLCIVVLAKALCQSGLSLGNTALFARPVHLAMQLDRNLPPSLFRSSSRVSFVYQSSVSTCGSSVWNRLLPPFQTAQCHTLPSSLSLSASSPSSFRHTSCMHQDAFYPCQICYPNYPFLIITLSLSLFCFLRTSFVL